MTDLEKELADALEDALDDVRDMTCLDVERWGKYRKGYTERMTDRLVKMEAVKRHLEGGVMDRQKCKAYNKNEDGRPQWCEVRNNCHRWTDQPKEVQAYGPPAPDFMPKDGCENYFPHKWEPKK